MRLAPLAALALPVLAALGGCSWFSSSDSGPSLVCPNAYRVQEAASLVRFKPGAGKDPIDILFQAQLGTLETACRFSTRENYVDVTLNVQILVAQGPTGTADRANFEYAVGVLGPTGTPLQRQRFATDVAFTINRNRGALTDEVRIRLPYNAENGASGYRIAVGLVLTPDEVDYNRRAAGTAGAR